MQREGPPLESLLHRLTETPEDFLLEPRIGDAGQIEVGAVVGDLLRLLDPGCGAVSLTAFTDVTASRDRGRLAVALLMTWLLSDEWFRQAQLPAVGVLALLQGDALELAAQTPAKKFVLDPERREEFSRLVLGRLGFRPAGETIAQAQDRLTTLSSAERARVLKASQAAAQRAKEIRAALVRKAAEESADKYTRE